MPATATGRGAQVVLTGQARRAARGSAGVSYVANVQIKAQLEQQGAIGTGYSPDGTTATNAPAHDVAVLAPETELGDSLAGGSVTQAQLWALLLAGLPTTLPATPGVVWLNGQVLCVS